MVFTGKTHGHNLHTAYYIIIKLLLSLSCSFCTPRSTARDTFLFFCSGIILSGLLQDNIIGKVTRRFTPNDSYSHTHYKILYNIYVVGCV